MRVCGDDLLKGTHLTCIDVDIGVDFDACDHEPDAL